MKLCGNIAQKKRFQLSYIVICKNYVKIMLY